MSYHLMQGEHNNEEACHSAPYGERWLHQDYLGDVTPSDGSALVTGLITPSRGKATVLKLSPQSVVSPFRY